MKFRGWYFHSTFAFTLLFFSSITAAVQIATKVTAVGVNSNNMVFLDVADTIEQPGCHSKQVVLPPDSIIKDRVLSIALAAKASSAKVALKISGCYSGAPTIDTNGADVGWIYITDQESK